jgi:hypothetical protein
MNSRLHLMDDLREPHCLFHRYEAEPCHCFPPSLPAHEAMNILRQRYIERTTPIFVPICRPIFAPASEMQHWRHLPNRKFTFPYPGQPMISTLKHIPRMTSIHSKLIPELPPVLPLVYPRLTRKSLLAMKRCEMRKPAVPRFPHLGRYDTSPLFRF